MPEYKLYYFNVKGRGEIARLMFAYAGVEYEDIRIPFNEWKSKRADMPYRQMPVLEVDGKKYCQSAAIVRFLAREFNLVGTSSSQLAKADEFAEATYDVMQKLPWTEKDPDKKKELMNKAFDEDVPPLLALIEENFAFENSYSGAITYAEIGFAGSADYLLQLRSDVLDKTPKLQALYKKIMENPGIAKYVKQRPETDM